MDLELRLREAVRMQDPGDMFTARVMGAVGNTAVIDIRTRRRSRVVVIGVVMVVGAAAAMLALQLSNSSVPPVMRTEREITPQPVVPERLMVDEKFAAIEMPSPVEQGAVNTPSVAPSAVPLPETPHRLTVLVMPSGDLSGEPAAERAAEAFRAMLFQEFQRISDLVVIDSGRASSADAANADIRLTTQSLKAQKLPSGGIKVETIGGSIGFGGVGPGSSGLGTEYWPVEARIQDAGNERSGAYSGLDYYIQPIVGNDGAPQDRMGCGFGGSMRRPYVGDMGQRCRSVADIARVLTDVIRQQTVDPQVLQRQLVTQLRDPSSREDQRRVALSNLTGSVEDQLDASAISAIVDFISGLAPAQRRQEWRRLRGRKEPMFVQPMLDVLRNDADEEVRLEVLQNLTTAYGGDRQVMVALEALARDDPREMVRMAARRTLLGDAEWNRYVLTTLRDGSIPGREKLQLLAFAGRSVSASQMDTFLNILNDEDSIKLAISVVRGGKFDTSQQEFVRNAVSLLGRVDRPEVIDLLIELTQDGSSGSRPGSMPIVEAMSGLMRHRDEPRVRTAIDKAMAGNDFLRAMFERQLAGPHAGPPLPTFGGGSPAAATPP